MLKNCSNCPEPVGQGALRLKQQGYPQFLWIKNDMPFLVRQYKELNSNKGDMK
jgi:hypothetical protein